jgi:putative NADH-flavin reductase
MNVLIFGANGKTGKLVVEKALAVGHTVTAFLRTAAEIPNVRVVTGDASDPASVRTAVAGQQTVIDTIGGKTPWKSTTLERVAASNIIAAMQAESARRLIVVSMMGLGSSRPQAPFWYRSLLMTTFLHGSTADKTAMETAVTASDLDYTIVRPPILTEDAATGSILAPTPPAKAHKITRADLAQFLVDQITSTQYLKQDVVVANS